MKYVLALIVTLALTGAAPAQHAHGNKGPNGGQLQDVAGVHAELVISGSTITINILDEDNKPVGTKGFIASALVARGSERETVALVPSEEAALKREEAGCRSRRHGHAEDGRGEVRTGAVQAVELLIENS